MEMTACFHGIICDFGIIYIFLFGLEKIKAVFQISLTLNLTWRKERTTLDDILSEDVIIMPSKGVLKACAMSLPVSRLNVLLPF